MAGRGSFIESFPLFGFDLRDYDELFVENLELLLRLRHRSACNGRGRTAPRSTISASTRGRSGAAAGLGRGRRQPGVGDQGRQARPADGARDHRRQARALRAVRRAAPPRGAEAGHDPLPPVSINSHAYIAETSEQAAEEFFPAYSAMMNAIGKERGWSEIRRPDFDALRTLRGALVVGSPRT
jgi:hypothetical protein